MRLNGRKKIMNEQTKYETVWRDCARYGKNWTDKGLGKPYKKPFLAKVPRGSTVMDFGCGNGSSLTWLRGEGFTPRGIEIAENAITSNRELIEVGDLRKDISGPQNLYGLCTDLMEHIPTEDVETVLDNIAGNVRVGAFFGIARLPDKDGDALGLQLHLTIQDKEWWDERLLKFFSSVEVVRYDDGCYLVWAIK